MLSITLRDQGTAMTRGWDFLFLPPRWSIFPHSRERSRRLT